MIITTRNTATLRWLIIELYFRFIYNKHLRLWT